MARQLVSYIRVSTSQQGRSGLGIEAQRATLARFAENEGFDIIAEMVEVETGKGSDALDRRPQLAAALATARRHRCSVAVAKLDRLSRDVHFISGLMAHRVPFLVAELRPRRGPIHPVPVCRPGGEGTRLDRHQDEGSPCGSQSSRREARRTQAGHGT